MIRVQRLIIAATLLTLGVTQMQAAVFIFNETTSTTTQWSAGTSWDATPVSDPATILEFGGGAALAAGTNVVSNNDLVGNFVLNQLNFTYAGPASGTAPTLTVTGNPLEFTGSGARIFYNPTGALATSRPRLVINSNIVLSSDLSVRVQSTGTATPPPPSPEITLNGAISGNFGVEFSAQPTHAATFVVSNPNNSYSGDTRFVLSTTSGRDVVLSLAASEVLPNGVGKGNLFLNSSSEAGRLIVQLNGNTETINGLSSGIPANASGETNVNRIRNNSAQAGTLIIGDNNASATFVGMFQDGTGGGALNVTKIGSGTQVYSGVSTHTGATRIDGGTFKVDYTLIATSATSAPTNYFSTNSDIILAGDTTFAIEGRGDGAAIEQTGISVGSGSRSFSLPNELASQLVVGQVLNFTKTSGSGTLPASAPFITAIGIPGATTTVVTASARVANSSGLTADLTIDATVGTTSQTLKSLTLGGLNGEVATIDFGMSDSVVLTFSEAPIQLNDGSILNIANWNGVLGTGGGAERLLFTGITTDFSSVFDQSEVIFDGYGIGYDLVDFGSFYEVVAVPEPASAALFGLGAIALLAFRRRARCAA